MLDVFGSNPGVGILVQDLESWPQTCQTGHGALETGHRAILTGHGAIPESDWGRSDEDGSEPRGLGTGMPALDEDARTRVGCLH